MNDDCNLVNEINRSYFAGREDGYKAGYNDGLMDAE